MRRSYLPANASPTRPHSTPTKQTYFNQPSSAAAPGSVVRSPYAQSPQAAPVVAASVQPSIFIDGDTVGVRRKSHQGTPLSPAQALPTSAEQLEQLEREKAQDERRRQILNLQKWLQQSRQHEVSSHRAEKHATPMEKWKRAVGGAEYAQHGGAVKGYTTGGRAIHTIGEAEDAQPAREPIRYSLRRAHEVLRQAEAASSGRLLQAPAPRMGAPIDTLRPSGLPGPGSYRLPSQF